MTSTRAPRRERRPGWVRVGDFVCELMLGGLLLLSLPSWGLETSGAQSIYVGVVCAMGVWLGVRTAFGPAPAPAMRAFVVGAMALFPAAWLAMQAMPLPRFVVGMVSPARLAMWQTVESVGTDVGVLVPLALAPHRAAESALFAFLIGIVFLVAVTLARHREPARRMVWGLLLLLSLEGALGVASTNPDELGRARGTLYNPNHFAALVFLCVPLAIAVTIDAWDRHREGRTRASAGLFAAAPALAGLIAGSQSGSRAGIAAGFAGVALLVGVEVVLRLRDAARFEGWRSQGGRIAAILVALAFAGFLGSTLLERALARGEASGIADTGERLGYWRAAMDGWREFPWLGLGGGGVEASLLEHSRGLAAFAPVHAHNDWVEVLAEWGLLGTGVWTVLIVFALALTLRADHSERRTGSVVRFGAQVGVVVALAHAFFDFHLRLPGVALPFMLVLALAFGAGTRNAFPSRRTTAE